MNKMIKSSSSLLPPCRVWLVLLLLGIGSSSYYVCLAFSAAKPFQPSCLLRRHNNNLISGSCLPTTTPQQDPTMTRTAELWMIVGDDLETDDDADNGGNRRRRRRKRDIIRKWGSSIVGYSSLGGRRHAAVWRRRRRNKLLALRAASAANDEEEDKEEEKKAPAPEENAAATRTNLLSNNSNITAMIEEVKEKLDQVLTTVQTKFNETAPAPLVDFVQTVLAKLNDFKLIAFGFFTGAVLAIAAIIVPVYSSVESLSQPVTLFETILGDLEQAYVDPVDTQQLFETGVTAMLRSLDPYTEFEGAQAAVDLTESIDGKYAGVGLVIAGTPGSASSSTDKILPKEAKKDNEQLQKDEAPAPPSDVVGDLDDDDEDAEELQFRQKELARYKERGIRVVSAFEGYAFDYGLRVGDKLVAIDDSEITQDTTVDQVRNTLRGEPGTLVQISFVRDGVPGVQQVTMPRSVVRVRDVKLATLVGKPSDGIGYIQLSGFASEAGAEMRQAIRYLQDAAEDASGIGLQGLILDLRGNPGGLLTSAVDVASLLVPKGSDIVSAKGRGFPGVLYRSRAEPLLSQNTKLAVLVNGGTASAAEIVSGAVQDLDVGVIVGADRTFGKGLVQNVEDLPFNTALKFTVAKYYTPSGRCIQGVNYKEGSVGSNTRGSEDGRFISSKVADKDRSVFYTKSGRQVRDGGGIEADYKITAPKASALEVTLLRSGVLSEFAAEWCKSHELTNQNLKSGVVDEDTYKSFIAFVNQKQRKGELQLEALYNKPLVDLKKALKQSGYKGSQRGVEQLQANILREIQRDFERHRSDISEDIAQNILARYLPESMLIERTLQTDTQVQAAVKLVASSNKFDRILARGQESEATTKNSVIASSSTAESKATSKADQEEGRDRIRASIQW